METPRTARHRTPHNPTPRMSQRKKSLFSTTSVAGARSIDSEQENQNMNTPVIHNKKTPASERGKSKTSATETTRSGRKSMSFLKNSNNMSPEHIDDDVFEKLPGSPPLQECTLETPSRRNTRLQRKLNMNSTPVVKATRRNTSAARPENLGDELPALFTNSMDLNKTKSSRSELVVEESSEDELVDMVISSAKKRPFSQSFDDGANYSAKMRRTSNAERLSIPTRTFYSSVKTASVPRTVPRQIVLKPIVKTKRSVHKAKGMNSINKGVYHKVRKPINKKSVHRRESNISDILDIICNEKLRNLITSKRIEKNQIDNIHRIFKSGKNPIEMAKPLSIIDGKRPLNDGNNNDPTTLTESAAFPRSVVADVSMGFSDIECSSESEEEEQEAEKEEPPQIQAACTSNEDVGLDNQNPSENTRRKFFKSGHSSTKKEVQITGNIKASVHNGKISLIQDTKRRKKRLRLRTTRCDEFSSEQATVNEILKNLDDSTVAQEEGDQAEEEVNNDVVEEIDLQEGFELNQQTEALCNEDGNELIGDDAIEHVEDFEEFRRRLPYNTDDPDKIEQQHILLDFLITNKICNEETFTIFIADPDNHKQEAEQIVDQIVVVSSEVNYEDYLERIPYNTTNPEEITQQRNLLNFLIENDMCTEENFQIFIADYANRHEEAERIITEVIARTHNLSTEELELELNLLNEQPAIEGMDTDGGDQPRQVDGTDSLQLESTESEKLFPIFYRGRCQPIDQPKSARRNWRTLNAGYGMDQYQIDAGQKQFGATQCKQCGLVYTRHEPEEEQLHKDFHTSVSVLKFKSWIDEDIVQVYPEWGTDGRILRLTDLSHSKRLDRLREVLQLVDKELGFSSFHLPHSFIAYLAVRQGQIVGLCLVVPLTQAHRYISQNGIDCCSEETFESRCGISRIWVSPIHRRFHIASKLIRAVQLNTIFGEEISLDKIAFSAPTADGIRFAQAVTKRDDFLVYQ